MRILFFFGISFCAGAALGLLPYASAILALGGFLLVAGALVGLFLRRRELRLTLILLGAGLGLLWSWGYHQIFLAPALRYDGETLDLTAQALDYSRESTYGTSVTASLSLGEDTVTGVLYLDGDLDLKPGDIISVTAQLEDSAADGEYYGRSEGLLLYAYAQETPEIQYVSSIPKRFFCKVIAHRLEESLQQYLPRDVLGYATALTTGNRTLLTTANRADLKAAGIYHALALSGMHLAVLLGMLGLLLRPGGAKALLGIPLIWAFTLITGASPSMVRAAVMACLLLLSYPLRREQDIPTSLALALWVLTLENPWCLLNWGLQLSFLSVIGLCCFGPGLYRRLAGSRRQGGLRPRFRRFFASALAACGGALSLTLPLQAAYFGFVSLVSPLTNLLVGWAISLCFAGCLLTAVLGLGIPILGQCLGFVTGWGLRYVDWVARSLGRLPWSCIYTSSIYGILLLLLLYGLLLLLLLRPKLRAPIPLSCMGVSLGLCLVFLVLDASGTTFTALDVGQGQCLVLQSGASTVLVDCGGNLGDAGDIAADYLAARGTHTVDLLILTHYDSDHTGGLDTLLARLEVGQVLMPDQEDDGREAVEEALSLAAVPFQAVSQALLLEFGGSQLQLFPPVGTSGNDGGLGLLWSAPGLSLLVTGDMSSTAEQVLAARYDLGDVDILVAGHHGSASSTSAQLLAAVTPELVVISVGENRYGHPAQETLTRIGDQGSSIYRTDQCGTITIKGAKVWQKEKSQ